MKNLFGSKDFYKRAFIILIPVIFQQLLTNFVVFIDNFMVGQLGDNAISGVYAANQLFFVATTALFGLAAGGSIYLSQFYGKKNLNGVAYAFKWLVTRMFIVIALIVGAIMIFEDQLMGMFTDDPAVLKEAKDYLKIIIWSYLPLAALFAYDSIFRTSGKPKWSLYGSVIALFSNVIFNYMFIFGNFGAPKMGVAGAAMSTLFSRIIQLAAYYIFAKISFREVDVVKVIVVKQPKGLSKEMSLKSLPMFLNEFAWSISLVVAVVIVSTRGENVLAAFAIRHSVSVFGYVIFGSFSAVIAVMIGNELGANNIERAQENFKKLVFLGFKISIVIVTILWIITPGIVGLFNSSPEVTELAIRSTRYGALLFPIFIIAATSFFALRSGGDMKIPFLLDSLWNWCVFIPTLYFLIVHTEIEIVLAFVLGWGTDIVKATISLTVAWRGNWAKNIVNKYDNV